jgi:Holliday junction DNA helicase RuvB
VPRTFPPPPSAYEQRLEAVIKGTLKPDTEPTGDVVIAPASAQARSHNPLRPTTLHDLIGQGRLKKLLRRLIDAAIARDQPLDHMMLVGPSGMGKTTISNIVANEMGVEVYQLEAPISHDTLLALRTTMQDKDILFVDEVHQQGIMDRRSRDSSTQPEVLFSVMEDRTIVTGSGVLPFPTITVIGATTDEGRLPDPFLNRFPIRPEFDAYTVDDLALMAERNAAALNVAITQAAADRFAFACRGVPRLINNYVKNAVSLADAAGITEDLAIEVIEELNRTTDDGLSLDMQRMLAFMYEKCKQQMADGRIVYKAGLGSIARGIGKSRDVKAVELRVEPYLIEQGYLQVGHGGRRLTDAGVTRAIEIINLRGTP